jgi:hypothetical protein
MDQRPYIRPETLQLVQERVGNILEHIGIGINFLTRTLLAQQLRKRIYKWDNMKLKSFCTAKEMATEWEKIFAIHLTRD